MTIEAISVDEETLLAVYEEKADQETWEEYSAACKCETHINHLCGCK